MMTRVVSLAAVLGSLLLAASFGSASAAPVLRTNGASAASAPVEKIGYKYKRRYYNHGSYVRAPFAEVDTRRGTWVAAPFVRVYSGRHGTWVRAPFVNLWSPR